MEDQTQSFRFGVPSYDTTLVRERHVSDSRHTSCGQMLLHLFEGLLTGIHQRLIVSMTPITPSLASNAPERPVTDLALDS
jgi:hypothetical protein